MIDNAPLPEPILWTPRQAAAALQVSERTLFTWTRERLIPVVRLGRTVRYSPAAVQRRLVELMNEGPSE